MGHATVGGWLVLLAIGCGGVPAADTMPVGDTGSTDTSGTDTGSTDTSGTDTSGTDTGSPDTGSPDTGATDTGSPDTGSPDTGSPDTGSIDTSATDTSGHDSGHVALPPELLLRNDAVAPGAECPSGGEVVHAGFDLDGDGILDDDEIVVSAFVCHPVETGAPPPIDTGEPPAVDTGEPPAVDTSVPPVEDTAAPACTLYGSVVIANGLDVTLMSGVCRVTGDVEIVAPGLFLGTLPDLEVIDGGLYVYDNAGLTFEFPALESIGRGPYAYENSDLSLQLPALTSVGSSVTLSRNQGATTLSIPALSSASSLQVVEHGGPVVVVADSLTSLDELEIAEVSGGLDLQLPVLTDVSGLLSYDITAGLLGSPFDALKTVGDLDISMPEGEALNLVLPSLTTVTGDILLYQGVTLAWPSDVHFEAPLLLDVAGDVTIDTSGVTSVILPSLDRIGEVLLAASYVADLAALELPALREVGTIYVVASDPLMPTLDLPALEVVHGELFVDFSGGISAPLLSSVGGASYDVDTIFYDEWNTLSVQIGSCGTVDLSGLGTVSSGGVHLRYYPALTCAGTAVFDLGALEAVPGELTLNLVDYLSTIRDGYLVAPLLTDVDSLALSGADDRTDLSGLQRVAEHATLYRSAVALSALSEIGDAFITVTGADVPVLATVGGRLSISLFDDGADGTELDLPALTSVGTLDVQDVDWITRIAMPSLTTVTGPSGFSDELDIADNGALTILELPALATVNGDLVVENNPTLCESVVDTIIGNASVTGASTNLGNDPGC